MKWLASCLVFCAFSVRAATTWYAAANGSATNGTVALPWSPTYAVTNTNPHLAGGDTVLFMGAGPYVCQDTNTTHGGGVLEFRKSGTLAAKITYKSSNLWQFTFEGGLLFPDTVSNLVIHGFRITSSNSVSRNMSNDLHLHPPGINHFGENIHLLHNLIENIGHPGIGSWSSTRGKYIAGNVIRFIGFNDWSVEFNGGNRGSGMYLQNDDDTAEAAIWGNISYFNYTTGMKAYGNTDIWRFNFRNNILAENVEAGIFYHQDNDGGSGVTVETNYMWKGGYGIRLGYPTGDGGHSNAVVRGNYVVGYDTLFYLVNNWRNTTWSNNIGVRLDSRYPWSLEEPGPSEADLLSHHIDFNTYYSTNVGTVGANPFLRTNISYSLTDWREKVNGESNSTHSYTLPTSVASYVFSPSTDTNFVHVAVFNWPQSATTTVDLSAYFPADALLSIYDAQNVPTAYTNITFGGTTVTLDLARTNRAVMLGVFTNRTDAWTGFDPRFRSFVIHQTGMAEAEPATSRNLVHNGSFEVGPSGWTVWGSFSGDTFGNEAANSEHITSTNASHGAKSLWWRTRSFSRPFYAVTSKTYRIRQAARTTPAGVVTYTNTIVPNWFVNGAASDLTYPALSQVIMPTNTAWKYFTNTFTVPTNWLYCVKNFCNSASTINLLDEVSVEESDGAGAWTPVAPIEVGMDTADRENVLFLSDTKHLRFNLWNSGAQTNVTVRYDIYDLRNSNVVGGSITTNALAANTNTTINLALPAYWGWLRIKCYITNLAGTDDETTVALLPFAAQTGYDTNGILGLHSHYSPHHLSVRRLGFAITRAISPITEFRWENIFPTTTTTNIHPLGTGHWLADYAVEYMAASTNFLIPFIPLSASDSHWHPETNASQAVMVAHYTNDMGKIVARYSGGASNVKFWEIWNEPQQNPRDAIALYTPSVYAALFAEMARMIKLIDATSRVIAMGGLSNVDEVSNNWNAFSAQAKTDTDIISVHNYPQDVGSDPNLSSDDLSFTVSQIKIANYIKSVIQKPWWNTETAIYTATGYKGMNAAWGYPFFFAPEETVWSPEIFRSELDVRQLPGTDSISQNFLRSIGLGASHFNVQNGRMSDDAVFSGTHPSIYELNGTIKPETVGLLIARHFAQNPGLDRITNANVQFFVEAYLITNIFGTVIPIWNSDRGNRTLTLSQSAVALFDEYGNLLQTNVATIPITRSTRYLVSGTVATATLRAAVENATVATNQDTRPPSVAIDITPIGEVQVAGAGVTNLFKWSAIDETSLPYKDAGVQTNVLTRFSFDGLTWSDWTQRRHLWTNLPVQRNYALRVQAKDKANNISEVVHGPEFGDLEYVEPNRGPTAAGSITLKGRVLVR